MTEALLQVRIKEMHSHLKSLERICSSRVVLHREVSSVMADNQQSGRLFKAQ
jgi:hypothetical protein